MLNENTPGLVGVSWIRTPELTCPSCVDRTVSVMRPVPNSSGNCASIRDGEVLISGIATSFAVTQTPRKLRGNGMAPAAAESARFDPKIEMREPGENCLARLAVFTTPPAENDGARPAAGVSDTILNP